MKFKYHLETSWRANRLDFYIVDIENDGVVQYELPTIFARKMLPAEPWEKPSLSFSFEDGQQIMDELYRLGFRPSPSMTKEISNRDEHLSDMKKLVERAYKVKF